MDDGDEGSFALSGPEEVDERPGLALLELLVLDLPVVVLIEEPEDLPEVLGLLLEELVEDVELGPLDLVIIVEVVGLQQLLLHLLAVQALQVLGVGRSLDVSHALLHHLQDWVKSRLTEFGVEDRGKFVEIGSSSVLLELLGQFLAVVLGTGVELLHLLGSDDAVVVVVDDPEEGLVEVLIA